MSQRFSTQVFVPTERFLRQIASAVLATLDGAGFAFERQRGQGGRYWVHEDLDWRETDRLEEIWDQFDKPGEWSIELWKSRPNGEDRELHLSVERMTTDSRQSFAAITLSTPFEDAREDPLLSLEFLAWSTFLAELVHPHYGWGGTRAGLFDPTPISVASLAALEPQPLEWLNIFGPPYVQRLGMSRLLSVPAWRVQPLADGSVVVVLSPDLDRFSVEDARTIMQVLGLPEPPTGTL